MNQKLYLEEKYQQSNEMHPMKVLTVNGSATSYTHKKQQNPSDSKSDSDLDVYKSLRYIAVQLLSLLIVITI